MVLRDYCVFTVCRELEGGVQTSPLAVCGVVFRDPVPADVEQKDICFDCFSHRPVKVGFSWYVLPL